MNILAHDSKAKDKNKILQIQVEDALLAICGRQNQRRAQVKLASGEIVMALIEWHSWQFIVSLYF